MKYIQQRGQINWQLFDRPMLIILYNSIIYKSAFNQASILILEYCSTYISDQKSISFSHDIPVASTSLFSLKLIRRRSLSGHTEWLYVRHPDTQFFYPGNGLFFNIAIISIAFLMELWPPEFLSRFTKYITFCSLSHETLRRLDLGVTQCIL